MSDFLERLYAAKREALAAEEARESYAELAARADARRSERRPFARALRAARGPAVVAEIKRASPSVGLIARNFDPAVIAANYELAGADAISVLTEADHFLGDLAFLDVARKHSTKPILRKDFLSTPYHIAQAAAYGADAVLLIVAGLDDATLRELSEAAARFELDTLVEVHDEEELARALAVRPAVIGINNRDLRTFATDLGVTEHLLPSVPAGTLVISESGVHEPTDVARLHARGARGFLIGEALMRADDPAAFIDDVKKAAVGAT
jgi:indole-3-glycerol phosphate synthase